MKMNDEVIRKIILSDEFSTYYDNLNTKIQDKYAYALHIIKTQKIVSEEII